MSHSEHFLQRLDRLSTRHTEEALLLYNDAPLLRGILAMARVPADVERVALALDDDGPHIVVTRDGHFVTCLGAGMSVGPWPVVSRRQLDGFTSRVGGLRARMELARSLSDSGIGRAMRLLERLYTDGPDLSRENFHTLTVLQPLLVPTLLEMMAETLLYMDRTTTLLAQTPLGPRSRLIARSWRGYWNAYWRLGHLSMLLAHDGSGVFGGQVSPAHREALDAVASLPARMSGTGMLLRGAWAAGRMGKSVLAPSKARLREAGSTLEMLAACLSLLAIGARHAALRSEVLKCLASLPEQERFAGAHRFQRDFGELCTHALNASGSLGDVVREGAGKGADSRRARRGLAPVALSDDMVVPSLALDVGRLSGEDVWRLPAVVVAIARLPGEALYTPASQLESLGHGPWTPAQTRLLGGSVGSPRPRVIRSSPVTVLAPPGRNEACLCGCGAKTKRCRHELLQLIRSAPSVRQPAQARKDRPRYYTLPILTHGARSYRLQRPLLEVAG